MPDDIHFRVRAYEPWPAYGQSKTTNALLAVEVTKRWADDGITSICVGYRIETLFYRLMSTHSKF